MGYTTIFKGRFTFDREVDSELVNYINTFARIRHVKRDVERYKEIHPDWTSKCFDGNPGTDGEYIIEENDNIWTDPDKIITGINTSPGNCPGLWCQWVIRDNKYLEWDQGEKFYKYVDWLEYLIDNFFGPKNYILNGQVSYQGENENDNGIIKITNNKIIVT